MLGIQKHIFTSGNTAFKCKYKPLSLEILNFLILNYANDYYFP